MVECSPLKYCIHTGPRTQWSRFTIELRNCSIQCLIFHTEYVVWQHNLLAFPSFHSRAILFYMPQKALNTFLLYNAVISCALLSIDNSQNCMHSPQKDSLIYWKKIINVDTFMVRHVLSLLQSLQTSCVQKPLWPIPFDCYLAWRNLQARTCIAGLHKNSPQVYISRSTYARPCLPLSCCI